MPLSEGELRALETALRQEAEETLRARGWNGQLVLVQNPYADELALRIQGQAVLRNQVHVPAHMLDMNDGMVTGVDLIRHQVAFLLRQFPSLPGSPNMTAQTVTDLRRLDEMGILHGSARPALNANDYVFRQGGGPSTPTIAATPKKPTPKKEPEPMSRWELLMGDDLL